METTIFEIQWKRDQVWKGCMLASIAHAIMVAQFPETSNEHSWDGINYSVQDSAGTRGTITFQSQYCVAAFRNDKSTRISSGGLNVDKYFEGAPSQIIELAKIEALQYLLDNVNGVVAPVITTAFWGVENRIFTKDEYEQMLENGAFILERQLLDFDSSLDAWIEYYDMNDEQVTLMKSIYKRKISNPSDVFRITDTEIGMIGSDNQEGLAESKISFEEIGIILEV